MRPLSIVLYCAHDKEETKTSLLSSQEVFGFSIDFASRKEGRIQSAENEVVEEKG
jgi:hypothetical protein